jgi:hypothetical protein
MTANAPIAAERRGVGAGAAGGGPIKRKVVELLARRPEVPITAVTILLGVYFLNTAVDFATSGNLGTLASFVAATAIIAVGAFAVITPRSPSAASSSQGSATGCQGRRRRRPS